MKHDFCVIGLGRFGKGTVDELARLKKRILVIDENKERVNEVGNIANYAMALDATNQDSLESVGVGSIPNVIVAISTDMEASILICAILKEMGVKNIVAKASSNRHEKILRSLGIVNIIRPEAEAGKQAVIRSIYGIGFKILELGDEYSVAEAYIKNPRFIGKTLQELDLRKHLKMNVALIHRKKEVIFPDHHVKLEVGDKVTFLAENKLIQQHYNLLMNIDQRQTQDMKIKMKK